MAPMALGIDKKGRGRYATRCAADRSRTNAVNRDNAAADGVLLRRRALATGRHPRYWMRRKENPKERRELRS
jgi:hypothetical protein